MLERSRNLTQQMVYDLDSSIVKGDFQDQGTLSEAELCERFDISLCQVKCRDDIFKEKALGVGGVATFPTEIVPSPIMNRT